MSNTTRRYRLLKDLPDAKAGTILNHEQEKDLYTYTSKADELRSYHEDYVEHQKDWFEEIKEELPDPITVSNLKPYHSHLDTQTKIIKYTYGFETNREIHDKLEGLREVMEDWLNERKPVFDTQKINRRLDELRIAGVDPFRANFEWETNDGTGRVIMKRDIRGKWLVSYHGRPDSLSDFEKEVKEASKYYGNNILCEECGEIGRHKENCPSRSRTTETPATDQPKRDTNQQELEKLLFTERTLNSLYNQLIARPYFYDSFREIFHKEMNILTERIKKLKEK